MSCVSDSYQVTPGKRVLAVSKDYIFSLHVKQFLSHVDLEMHLIVGGGVTLRWSADATARLRYLDNEVTA